MSKAGAQIEEEMKIDLSRDDLEKVFARFARRGKAVQHKYFPRHYYDTPALELYGDPKHISLRLQYNIGAGGKLGGYKQTVKFQIPSDRPLEAGIVLRRECPDRISGRRPDLGAVTDAEAKKAIEQFKDKKLTHIFTAQIERRYFKLSAGKGKHKGTIEMAFDSGEIVIPGINEIFEFSEVELELKGGSAKAISPLKDEIIALAPSARVEAYSSKADIGTKLYRKHVLGQ